MRPTNMTTPKPWTASDVVSAGESRAMYFEDRLKNADKARTDAKREQRVAMHECKFCFYFGHGLAGQAFTDYVCAGCSTEQMHGNTAVPKLCRDCGNKMNACVRCGGTMEWKTASEQRVPPKEKRNQLVVEVPDLVSEIAADPKKIARNAKQLAKKVERTRGRP
jgi:hypothetical protein